MKMIDNYKIGNRIALLRREKGLTGESFAEKLGVSPQAVSKWENGKNLPETALLPAISALLGTSIDSILIPQELVILDARYTCGESYIVVTDAVNRAVDSNKLQFKAECPNGSHFVDGSAVFVLTAKYQTPKGSYYAFVPQGEILNLDLESEGMVAKKDFEIVGAYYGIREKYKSVMDKMQHYEYFNWNEIHVNHETFPSSPGVDESEYLTLVYMNSAGIHVISCEENGILRYTDDRTGMHLKNTSTCILSGIAPLSWGNGMDCCWGGSLYTALKYMGESYTYEQIMGMSGACYRINFTEVWDWSATDALVVFDYSAILFRAIGYEQVWADRLNKDKRSSERKMIVSDIQMGKPVVAINLRVAAEWGVITGYADNGMTLYCRTYFDGDLLDESGKVKTDGSEYLETENWPFMLVHFGNKGKCPADKEIFKASIQALIDSFRAPCERGYWQGEEAYKKWIKGLSNDSLWDLNNARDDFYRRASVNECTLRSLIDERHCAAVYLGECGQTVLSEMYQSIYERVKSFHDNWVHKWDKVSNDGIEWRTDEIELLKAVLKDETKMVEIAERIMLSFYENGDD
jgi:transcriptional regulator with XRE-family HTH domain